MKETEALQKEFLKNLGKHIKELRLERGLSQSEAANICGKERQSLERVENGRVNPTIWYLKNIADALGIELKELLNTNLTDINTICPK